MVKKEKERIVEAIRQAEKLTSGEIRVCLEKRAHGEILEAAKKTFKQLGMMRTKKRNGVLILVSLSDHRFAIVGDTGIHAKAGRDFWHSVAAQMETYFKRNELVSGLENGILVIGEVLKAHFPIEKGDRNELSNQISPS